MMIRNKGISSASAIALEHWGYASCIRAIFRVIRRSRAGNDNRWHHARFPGDDEINGAPELRHAAGSPDSAGKAIDLDESRCQLGNTAHTGDCRC